MPTKIHQNAPQILKFSELAQKKPCIFIFIYFGEHNIVREPRVTALEIEKAP